MLADGMSHPAHPAPHHHGDSWDNRASAYARRADHLEPRLRAVTEALLDAVGAGPGVRLLDLACGPGHTAAAAQARKADVLGLDLSAGMIGEARARFPSVRFAVGDMATPPAGPWDAIQCRDAHHADLAWMAAAFQVLRRGGRIALAETEPSGHGDHGGKRPAAEWKRLLEGAGFVDVAFDRIGVRLPGVDGASDAAITVAIVAGHKP
jgi:SAM-dependent methyltransferase